jgi:hypothetical protein
MRKRAAFERREHEQALRELTEELRSQRSNGEAVDMPGADADELGHATDD